MEQVGNLDPNIMIWRYLSFEKFQSLIRTSALFFTKLQVFEDDFEGMTPDPARSGLKKIHREMEEWFPDEDRKQQVRRFVEQNEADGRELIVAICWFIGDHESTEMWEKYAPGTEGVVIQSLARDLARSLIMSHHRFWIGRVGYIDPMCHSGMNEHEGSQARLRAFLKRREFSYENELRVATMNWVAPGCLNPDESSRTESQRAGLVYSPDRKGIFVKANLPILIRGLRTAPGAAAEHCMEVEVLSKSGGIVVPVGRSELL